ncbi:amidohydrolase [Nonomuraea deserti]|uniref:Amidohydrolase n=1 Tax=Nonomuraea deserti TaxID=1848322 RepID=A0A4R4UZL5_9ACTN|nr:amidohydrolase family protein [Nonomuraea deserti]TDC97771.1 amidohydrolase [Nonomuraea deserti]
MSRWGFPVIDFHCHFPGDEPVQERLDAEYEHVCGPAKLARLRANAAAYHERVRLARTLPPTEPETRTTEEVAAAWRADADDAGLTRVVFMSGGGNDRLGGVVAAHRERFAGFANHQPCAPGAAAELRRAVTELGLSGYKVIAPWVTVPLADRSLWPVWEVCEEYGLPVVLHFGPVNSGGGLGHAPNMDPIALHDVAKAFPSVNFVVAHFGCGYPGELLRLGWSNANVHVDTSSNHEWTRWMPYELTLKDLFRRFHETFGPERIVFGTDSCDFPWGYLTPHADEQVRIVAELNLSPRDRQLIFAGNAARLLGLDLPGIATTREDAA